MIYLEYIQIIINGKKLPTYNNMDAAQRHPKVNGVKYKGHVMSGSNDRTFWDIKTLRIKIK